MDAPAAPPQYVYQLMPCDRPNPWARRGGMVPALPLEVNGKQRLLHNVLGFRVSQACPGEALAGKGAKHGRLFQQKPPVSSPIALIGRGEERGPLAFLARSAQRRPSFLSAPRVRALPVKSCPSYHILVIANMRSPCNGPARGSVKEGVEWARRI